MVRHGDAPVHLKFVGDGRTTHWHIGASGTFEVDAHSRCPLAPAAMANMMVDRTYPNTGIDIVVIPFVPATTRVVDCCCRG